LFAPVFRSSNRLTACALYNAPARVFNAMVADGLFTLPAIDR